MKITFLIGNGFDVGLGLKSKFKDFFPTYVKWSEHKHEKIKQLSLKIGEDFETWADFELQMGQYTTEFEPSEMRIIVDQFRDFETEFMRYLEREQNKLSFEDKNAICQMVVSGLKNFYKIENLQPESSAAITNLLTKRRGEDRQFNFVSFNYTSLLESCLNTITDGIIESRKVGGTNPKDTIGKIVHVHGTRNNSPIMGVCDASQIANRELANNDRFLQYFVKPRINTMHRTRQDADASALISQSDIICIYGMALGATDKNWWKKILSWLNSGADHHLVIFDFDPNFSTTCQFDWIDKENSILDKLSCYAENTIDIEKLRPRIHIAVHKNIFAMDLTNQLSTNECESVAPSGGQDRTMALSS